MRPREDELIDPEIAEQLDAIDATLSGEPVAPRFAELAELALLVSVVRPEAMRPEFAAELDGRVEARFGRGEAMAGRVGAAAGDGASARGRSRWRAWSLTPVLGTAAGALVAAVVAVVLVTSGGGTGGRQNLALSARALFTTPSRRGAPAVKSSAPSAQAILGRSGTVHGQSVHGRGGAGGGGRAAPTVPLGPAPERSVAKAQAPSAPTASGSATTGSINGSNLTLAPAPVPNGRKVIQSSILQLGAPGRRIDAVAQDVFDVVGAVNGIVDSSNVSSTGGPGASAQFQLRVPSSSLSVALTDLSRLRYAHVISRTDNTQDVNSSYLSVQRQIAKAQAALARLRTQLAAATLDTEIAALRAQIAGEKATLARAQGSLGALNHQINYSRLEVSIVATAGGSTGGGGGGGFGLHKAGHDALRVLEVIAGVALIVLAGLVPIGLLAVLAWWLSGTVQRRRRERALDLA